uniref:Uncharacterized protein n=1 Tax=Corethron hystrix TaxID=216773 RepID=A0A7S1BA62_9STRA|mmetsp:Transcript_17848/g.40567  ORF Transcript_17848/g.40567 Transcript_17848/m.40567 type:complete len:121 (+) Transcript_17848:815-1177(+)
MLQIASEFNYPFGIYPYIHPKPKCISVNNLKHTLACAVQGKNEEMPVNSYLLLVSRVAMLFYDARYTEDTSWQEVCPTLDVPPQTFVMEYNALFCMLAYLQSMGMSPCFGCILLTSLLYA